MFSTTSHGWWMFGESIFWLLLIVGAIWLVIDLTRDSSARPSTTPSPLEILERRFARGEISSEELRERRAELTGRQTK
jgi:putative membrane protein